MDILPVMETPKFSPDWSTQVRIPPSVHREFRAALIALEDSGATYAGSKPVIETVDAALRLWFARLPRAEAEALLSEILPALERQVCAHDRPDLQGHDAGPSRSKAKKKGRAG